MMVVDIRRICGGSGMISWLRWLKRVGVCSVVSCRVNGGW